MGKKQYNSAADRRWQQRFQRIQERKETDWEYDQARRERRKRRHIGYGWQSLNIDRLVNGNVAVVCTSEKQICSIYTAIQRRYPQYVQLWEATTCASIWYYYHEDICLSVDTHRGWGGERRDLSYGRIEHYQNEGYEILYYDELLPVIDLGEVQNSPETVGFLLGI